MKSKPMSEGSPSNFSGDDYTEPQLDQKDVAVKKIFSLFKEFGTSDYVTNNVSLMEHSL